MKPTRLISAATLAACLALPLAVSAQSAPDKKGDELAAATCADIFSEMAAADPERNKGSADDVAAAQDNVYALLMWVNGYLNGRYGIDFAKRPLNQAGITALVNQVVAVCKPDPKQPFLTAIRKIKK